MKYVAELAAVFTTATRRDNALTSAEGQLPADTNAWRYRKRAVGNFRNEQGRPALLLEVEFDQQTDRQAWFQWIKNNAQTAAGLVKLAGRRHDCNHDEASPRPCDISEWKVWP